MGRGSYFTSVVLSGLFMNMNANKMLFPAPIKKHIHRNSSTILCNIECSQGNTCEPLTNIEATVRRYELIVKMLRCNTPWIEVSDTSISKFPLTSKFLSRYKLACPAKFQAGLESNLFVSAPKSSARLPNQGKKKELQAKERDMQDH